MMTFDEVVEKTLKTLADKRHTNAHRVVDHYLSQFMRGVKGFSLTPEQRKKFIKDIAPQILELEDAVAYKCHELIMAHVNGMMAHRELIKAGDAIIIVPWEESSKKRVEWRGPEGKKQLKLWERHENEYHSWGNRKEVSRRAVRDDKNKVVSFPPGTIGFVNLDYQLKSYRQTCNVNVSFKGYFGWTDYRNIRLYDHEKGRIDTPQQLEEAESGE